MCVHVGVHKKYFHSKFFLIFEVGFYQLQMQFFQLFLDEIKKCLCSLESSFYVVLKKIVLLFMIKLI